MSTDDRWYYRCVLCGQFIGYEDEDVTDISVQSIGNEAPDPEYAHKSCLASQEEDD